MADETIQGSKGYVEIIRMGADKLKDIDVSIVRTNGTDIKCGHIVTHAGETEPDVDLAVTTDGFALGVVVRPANLAAVLLLDPDWDIDDALPDNIMIEVVKLGSGVTVAVILEATAGPVAVEKGDILAIGTEAGKVRVWAYTDATEATDTLNERVGIAFEPSAGSATDDLVILMELR